ncbi:hypothetical protein [Streptomyces sp. SHP 1-2]|uniref:hypothetical protein n=1 Tax=Streptomyces sp. SHP 1-2 TaxID=2769489 RepID=UPI002238310B|nr:hypothetical protein [Streptomyces sp. SHP 1-2]MCW5254717.1 hypothetical protein [Streptomyces sp. SHP 1-2]
MTQHRRKEVSGVEFIETMPEEHARILWTLGGFGTREDFPGVRAAAVRMLQGVTASARRSLARFFASLAPRQGVTALAALLHSLAGRPVGIPLPVPAPRSLSPQRRCHRFTPARAP